MNPCVLTLLLVCALHGRSAAPEVRGSTGAIRIPFTQPVDGTASVGLYTREGLMVRPLAQNLALPAGPHVLRWDGLDLWGNPVPGGTSLEARVISGPGLSARYEFAIASPSEIPWPTRPYGEGAAMRTGGWLGDHGTAVSAVAVGDRVFVGSFMAEHGHTVAMCNLNGDKMWGRGGLEGWEGPRLLASDGQAVFGAVKKNRLHRLELDGSSSRQIADTGEDEITGLAAHDGTVWLTLKNHERFGSVVAPKVGGKDVDFKRCLPVPEASKAYNRLLTGEEQFAHTFFDGGHPQTGITPAANGPVAGIVAVFKKPVSVGTLLVERMEIPARAEFFRLKPGVAYNPATMAPKPGEAPGSDWQQMGASDLSRRVNVVSERPSSGLATDPSAPLAEALYIRLATRDGSSPKKWPKLAMCRILPNRLERVDGPATLTLPRPVVEGRALKRTLPGDPAWSFRSTEPMSEATPATVMLDYGKALTFDAVVLVNAVNARGVLDVWTGASAPSPGAAGWAKMVEFDPGVDKVEGSRSASIHANDQRITLPRTVTTRALRLRFPEGQGPGRWAEPTNTADPLLCEAADVALLRLVNGRPQAPEMRMQARDGRTGELQFEVQDPPVTLTALACDQLGRFVGLTTNQLLRLTLPSSASGRLKAEPLGSLLFSRPTCLGVSEDGRRLAVGDAGAHQVVLMDATGKAIGKIGGIGPRKKGPWDARTVEQPAAVALDRQGQVWVCERTYTPKRVTIYQADGSPVRELLGPPHYGGGGWLDPSLKSFWYEAAEYEIDFAKGTSRLKSLLDVQSDPGTPTLETSSYTYTKVGRPVRHGGHRYLVGDIGEQYSPGGFVVCLCDEGMTTWRPAAVLGRAAESEFLLREDKPWRNHWLKQELSKSSFIWCDLNGDGGYQIEEVQVFKNTEVMPEDKAGPFDSVYWGHLCGQDLTFWGTSARLAPTRFTAAGVPVYEKQRVQPFDYAKLAPVSNGAMVNNSSAKNSYGGTSLVARDGCLILEGQPYRVKPDLSLVGGPLPGKPSEYQPRVLGTVVDNPLSFIGSAATRSPVGEVAMINGNNGRWFLWAVDHGIAVGEIFTGEAGGWGALTTITRGADVTAYKQDWETFFGNFIGADNGNFYVVAGRGHWGVSRVEGVHDLKLSTVPVTVSPESAAANADLRTRLVAAAKASGRKQDKRELKLQPLAKRAKGFALDGELADWGKPGDFQKIGESGDQAFDAAWDDARLTLAYRGSGPTGNQSQDWKYLFKTGFCLDVNLRADPSALGAEIKAGDRRVVIGRHKGEWVAVLYDHVLAKGAGPEAMEFTSPVTTTPVDRVARLPASAVQVAFKENPDRTWSAEVQLAWSALGVTPKGGMKLRADAGILIADTAGLQVDRRDNWSDPDTGHVADLAVEARIHPGNWGTWIFQ